MRGLATGHWPLQRGAMEALAYAWVLPIHHYLAHISTHLYIVCFFSLGPTCMHVCEA